MGKFDLNRRAFLSALALGTAHLMFNNPLYGATRRFTSADPMQRVKLGNSGLNPTLLGVGTGVSGGNRSSFLTRQDEQKVSRHCDMLMTGASGCSTTPTPMGHIRWWPKL